MPNAPVGLEFEPFCHMYSPVASSIGTTQLFATPVLVVSTTDPDTFGLASDNA